MVFLTHAPQAGPGNRLLPHHSDADLSIQLVGDCKRNHVSRKVRMVVFKDKTVEEPTSSEEVRPVTYPSR